ncbi:MAG: hypothetical protein NT165_02210 [Candidatus Falkowbacteria bacterium]|nr:hypothetical protein [Candidatus Falkowbacteria bacterium]
MDRFIYPGYWFNLRPEPLTGQTFKFFIAFIFLLIILGATAYYLKTRSGAKNGLWLKIFNFSFTNTLLGVFLLFCNYEIIPFFTARFFLAFWVIGMLLWLFSLAKVFKKIPKTIEDAKKQDEFKKYLP